MTENKFKIRDKVKPSGSGLFGWMSRWVKNGSLFEGGFPVKYLPKVIFAVVVGVVYVWNTHYAERTVRKIGKLETEVEDLRADVTTLEADYMYSSKQSEVAKRVKALGLEESKEPPYKIVAEEGEY